MADFAAALVRLRESRAWTQEQAADAIGVSSRAYQDWEAGRRNPRARNRRRVAEVYELPVEQLELIARVEVLERDVEQLRRDVAWLSAARAAEQAQAPKHQRFSQPSPEQGRSGTRS